MKRIFARASTVKKEYRGVAQLVGRDIWDVEAAGSNPVTPTNKNDNFRQKVVVFFLSFSLRMKIFFENNNT